MTFYELESSNFTNHKKTHHTMRKQYLTSLLKSGSWHFDTSQRWYIAHCYCITTPPETHCSSNRTRTSLTQGAPKGRVDLQYSYAGRAMRGSDTPQKVDKAQIHFAHFLFPSESALLFPNLSTQNSVRSCTCAPFVPLGSLRPVCSFLPSQRREICLAPA